ncbi:MAG: hypothetical protein GXO77_12090 [Calditrichaeota bacterium]|nr:hypothetical protein [Calditrichota bacterium]
MIKKIVCYQIILTLIFSVLSQPVFAQQKQPYEDQLQKAKTLYYDGKFEEAQDIIFNLLKKDDLKKEQRFRALITLAEIRRAVNDEQGARKIIRKILEFNPDYNPTIREEPPTFVALVREERQKMSAKKPEIKQPIYKRSLFWAAVGGTVLTTVTVFLISNKKSKEKANNLPAPPNWPEFAK